MTSCWSDFCAVSTRGAASAAAEVATEAVEEEEAEEDAEAERRSGDEGGEGAGGDGGGDGSNGVVRQGDVVWAGSSVPPGLAGRMISQVAGKPGQTIRSI